MPGPSQDMSFQEAKQNLRAALKGTELIKASSVKFGDVRKNNEAKDWEMPVSFRLDVQFADETIIAARICGKGDSRQPHPPFEVESSIKVDDVEDRAGNTCNSWPDVIAYLQALAETAQRLSANAVIAALCPAVLNPIPEYEAQFAKYGCTFDADNPRPMVPLPESEFLVIVLLTSSNAHNRLIACTTLAAVDYQASQELKYDTGDDEIGALSSSPFIVRCLRQVIAAKHESPVILLKAMDAIGSLAPTCRENENLMQSLQDLMGHADFKVRFIAERTVSHLGTLGG